MASPRVPVIKVVVLGSAGVGKSALTLRFVRDEFSDNYDPTFEDSYRKQVEIGGRAVLLEILDTAGTDQLKMMRELYLHNSEAFVLVYSVASRASFNEVPNLITDVDRAKPDRSQVPAILVGNKIDLPNRDVTTEQGRELAERRGCLFAEVSAKENFHIDEVFADVVRPLVVRKYAERGDRSASGGTCKCSLM